MLKKLSIGLILLILASYVYFQRATIVRFISTKLSIPSNKGIRVHFSYTKYPQYQHQIVTMILKDFPDVPIHDSDIAVALQDINDDGMPEIFAFSLGSGLGGLCGWHTVIYSEKNGKFIPLWNAGYLTFGNLVVLPHKTNGYHDIMSVVIRAPFKKEEDGKNIFAWLSSHGYDYVKSESISDQEREIYANEDL